jgi:hypothetical protein
MANLEIFFAGHFSCRLATNPDPFDEPRGKLGMTRAYPGEPDLDRHIRLSLPSTFRTREIGGQILAPVVIFHTAPQFQCLNGLEVSLGEVDGRLPCFEGRDTAVADPGREPVIPLRVVLGDKSRGGLQIEYCNSLLDRGKQRVDFTENYTWQNRLGDKLRLVANDLRDEWADNIQLRKAVLEEELFYSDAGSPLRAVLSDRLRMYESEALMSYSRQLRAQIIECDTPHHISYLESSRWTCPNAPDFSSLNKWPLLLAFLGFDPDALAGICVGSVTIPLA